MFCAVCGPERSCYKLRAGAIDCGSEKLFQSYRAQAAGFGLDAGTTSISAAVKGVRVPSPSCLRFPCRLPRVWVVVVRITYEIAYIPSPSRNHVRTNLIEWQPEDQDLFSHLQSHMGKRLFEAKRDRHGDS
jgi:hypothetical protein